MKALITAVLMIAAATLFAFTPPVIAADMAQGGQVFATNCADCHVGGGNAIMSNKTLKKDALEQYLADYGTDHAVEAIVYQVTNGKNAMPAFKNRLTAAQIADVAAYVNNQAENGW